MKIALKLLQAIEEDGELTDDGVFKDFDFPGVAASIGDQPGQKPYGSELESYDGKKVKKEPIDFCKSVYLSDTDKDTVGELYQEFKEKYHKILSDVRDKLIIDDSATSVMTRQSLMTVKLDSEQNKDYFAWIDRKNGIIFYAEEIHCMDKEEICIGFHFKAWRCFDPLEGTRINMQGKIFQERVRAKNKKDKEEKKLKKVEDIGENIIDEEREKLAASLSEENEKNGVSPKE